MGDGLEPEQLVGTAGRRVLLATRNAAKLEEMRRILAEHLPAGLVVQVVGLDDVSAYDEPAETEPTFEGNARLKAHAAVAATGLPSLADDSGLCVDALNQMPGVLSARWAGHTGPTGAGREDKDRANNLLLLAQLADVPDERRTATFRCSVVLAVPTPAGLVEHTAEGAMPGRVIREARGTGGFGYDVVFCGEGHEVTTAELPRATKDEISHRGKALRAIAPVVAEVLATEPRTAARWR